MKTYDLFKVSTTAPQSGNVLWVDVSSGMPIIRAFNNGVWEATSPGSAALAQIDVAKPILYEDLFALWEAGELSTGMQYLITDYQTTYLMPNTEEVIICDVEPILVTATSNTTISPIAYSPRYPNDIIYYDIDSERIYGVGGGGSGSGDSSGSGSGSGVLSELMQPGASKGYIYRRVDTLNKIDAGFDWRTVKFRRWGIDYEQISIYDDTTTYQKGDLVRSYDGLNIYVTIKTGVYGNNGIASNNFARLCGSNDIILYKPNDVKLTPFQTNTLNANIVNYRDYSFIPKSTDDGSLSNDIKNIYFGTNTSDIIYRSNTVIIKGSYNIKVGSDCYHNTIWGDDNSSYDFELADSCISNTVGSGFVDNNIGKNFNNNVIGNSFTNNKFGTGCNSNTFGDNCGSNTFGDGCVSNTFGNNCYFNTFDYNGSSNTFGIGCMYNTFGNSCYSNAFDNNCSQNTFGDNCSQNTFGDGCNYNTFSNNYQSNIFGNSCYSNTFDNNCSQNTFGDNCSQNTFGDWLQSNTFGNGCNDNTFGNTCQSNTFGNSFQSNTFSNYCSQNTFSDDSISNTFGDYCGSNMFGSNCNYNTLSDSCYSNTLGNSCSYNTFSNYCQSNTFSNYCSQNTFSNNCNYNTFGDYCQSNTFDNNCSSNTFGNYCSYNTFDDSCKYNRFYTGTSGTAKKDYIQYLVLEGGCKYNNFYSSLTTSSSSYLQRIRIKGLENTTATDTEITLAAVNTNYEWLICYTSSAVLKQYCPND